jgi:RNA polymerase sigma-70 factor (ECF subfamily)
VTEHLDTRTDDQLVAACRDIQRDEFELAFEELYRRYRDRAFGIAYRITGTATDAMDAVQDAFRVLFQKISTFRFDSRFSTWLFRIVVNCSIDLRRRERSRAVRHGVSLTALDPLAEPAADQDDPSELAESSELGSHVHGALQRLSPKLRAVLVLRYLEGLSYEELADVLEVQLGTVKSRLARAHVALERVLHGTVEKFGYEPLDRNESSRSGSGHHGTEAGDARGRATPGVDANARSHRRDSQEGVA